MVELCELKLMNKEIDYWPPDIDQHVAQLDFDKSVLIDQSLFGSVVSRSGAAMSDQDEDEEVEVEEYEVAEVDEGRNAIAAAPAASIIISTDSLDMDLIHDCGTNKNDYKLTFEDSGQWTTTSGIGASITTNSNGSPPMRRNYRYRFRQQPQQKLQNNYYNKPMFGINKGILDRHFGLRLLEQLNNGEWSGAIGEANEEEKRQLIDNLLLNVAETAMNNMCDADATAVNAMTTWGRIRSAEPFDEKIYSLQDHRRNYGEQLRNEYDIIDDEFHRRRPLSSDDLLTLPAAPPPPLFQEQQRRQQQAFTTNKATTTDAAKIASNIRVNNDIIDRNNDAGGCCDNAHGASCGVCSSSNSVNSNASKRSNLLANFVEQHQHQLYSGGFPQLTQPPTDYEYNEVYVGDGRYVDVNDNEIGYVPSSTASIQKSCDRQSSGDSSFSCGNGRAHNRRITSDIPSVYDICGAGPSSFPFNAFQSKNTQRVVYGKPILQRDIAPSFTAPDLKFLSFNHSAPSFCRSQISLDEMLKKARNGSLLFTENLLGCDKIVFETSSELSILDQNNAQPDSGLGSSSSSGPSHIEDWPSLAVLLPRHVVDACSFFKTNSSLLTGSSSGSTNNIERKILPRNLSNCCVIAANRNAEKHSTQCDNACRTCFNVRRRHFHPPPWAHKNSKTLCDCTSCCCSSPVVINTTSEITSRELDISKTRLSSSASSTTALAARMPKLNAMELRVVGLPIYNSKRQLVERVVEGVAEIARGASAIVLWSALEQLLSDGLASGKRPWNVIVEVTGPGPATNNIYQLVKKLEASEKPENSRINHFFKEVLSLHSLEGWLSYVVLKENVLTHLYVDTAFLLRAKSAYRSLFWRLIESVELLSVLTQCQSRRNLLCQHSQKNLTSNSDWGSASRLPSDSRVPKSSSVPEKLITTPLVSSPKLKSKTPKNVNATIVSTQTNEKLAIENSVKKNCQDSMPSTSSVQQNAVGYSSSATLPRTSSITCRKYRSRIPIACGSTSRSLRSISSPTSMLHSQSIHTRTARTLTPTIIARARETVSEVTDPPGFLTLDKGEEVRILSIRGDLSRCCRLHSRHGHVFNGVVPTYKLDLY